MRELAGQIYDIYYLMQNYFAQTNLAYIFALVLVSNIVFSVYVVFPGQRPGDFFYICRTKRNYD